MPKTTFTVNKDELKVIMSRVFNGPRELIWKIMTNPEMIPQWWGPARFETVVDKMDFKVGGQWRFVQRDAAGHEFAFHGEYLEIIPQEKLADTFVFEGLPPEAGGTPDDHALIETAVLEDVGNGTTRMTTTSVYKTIQDLEGMVGSGMEGGAVESWERLAGLVEISK